MHQSWKNHQQLSVSFSHLDFVLALLPSNGKPRELNHHEAVNHSNHVLLNKTQDGHLSRNPRPGFEFHLTRHHIRYKPSRVRPELICLDRDPAGDPLGPPRRDLPRRDVDVADLISAVEDEALARAVAEGGTVGVADVEEEVEGDVELELDGWEGDTWGDAVDGGGEESSGGVLGFEESEKEDEDDRDKEEDDGGCDGAAAAEAPPWAWRWCWMEGLVLGVFVGGHVAEKKN